MRKLFPSRGVKVIRPASPAPNESKAVPVLNVPLQMFFNMTDEQRESQTVSQRRAHRLVWLIYACLTYRATKLTEAPLWIYEEDSDQQEEQPIKDFNHPLAELLKWPNADMTMGDLLTIVSLYEDVTGAALLVKNRNALGEVVSLYPFARDEFTCEPFNGQMYGRFHVTTLAGTKPYLAEDVIYFKQPSTENIRESTSPVDAALIAANVGYEMFVAAKSLLRNAVRPGATFETDSNLDPVTYERLREQLKEDYAGMFNRGKTLLLEQGLKMQPVKGSLGEIEMGPLSGDIDAAVCMCFGMHPILVGARIGLEHSGGLSDSIKPATDLFYDVTQFPRWQRYEERLTRGLLWDVDANALNRMIRFNKTKVRSLQIDMGARVEEAKNATGFWTIDEQRIWTGKTELPDKEQGAQLSQRTPVNPNGPNEGTPDEQRTPKPKKPQGKSFSVVRGAVTGALALAHWMAFNEKAQAQEAPYQRAAVRLFNAEREDIVQSLVTIGAAVGVSTNLVKAPDPFLLPNAQREWALLEPRIAMLELELAARYGPNGKYHKAWKNAYETLVRDTYAIGSDDVGGAIGLDFDMDNPRFAESIRRRVNKLSGNVSQTTLKRLKRALVRAQEEQIGLSQLITEIEEDIFGGTITRSRAATIARTETVGALNESAFIAADESELLQSKRWLSQKDEVARPAHEMEDVMSGWLPIRKKFPTTGKMYPHDGIGGAEEDVNCRCSLLFSDLTPDEANADDA